MKKLAMSNFYDIKTSKNNESVKLLARITDNLFIINPYCICSIATADVIFSIVLQLTNLLPNFENKKSAQFGFKSLPSGPMTPFIRIALP